VYVFFLFLGFDFNIIIFGSKIKANKSKSRKTKETYPENTLTSPIDMAEEKYIYSNDAT